MRSEAFRVDRIKAYHADLERVSILILPFRPIFTHSKHGATKFTKLSLGIERAPAPLGTMPYSRGRISDWFRAHVTVLSTTRAEAGDGKDKNIFDEFTPTAVV